MDVMLAKSGGCVVITLCEIRELACNSRTRSCGRGSFGGKLVLKLRHNRSYN